MHDTIHMPAAYPRLLQHPLVATFIAILGAAVLVVGVAEVSGHLSGAAFAGDGAHEALGPEGSPADAP